jgi:hypothetical protein
MCAHPRFNIVIGSQANGSMKINLIVRLNLDRVRNIG